MLCLIYSEGFHLRCPRCSREDTRVVDSRPAEDGRSVRRRRACAHCGGRFTTYERVDTTDLTVVKRDGRRERFDRDKIVRGITTSCEKRPVSASDIQDLVNDVEGELLAEAEHEISSVDIGNRVMARLRELDEVAYVRFASVYRSFADVEAFRDVIAGLKMEGRAEGREGFDI